MKMTHLSPIKIPLLEKRQQGFFSTTFIDISIDIIDHQITSYHIKDHNLYLIFGNPFLKS